MTKEQVIEILIKITGSDHPLVHKNCREAYRKLGYDYLRSLIERCPECRNKGCPDCDNIGWRRK